MRESRFSTRGILRHTPPTPALRFKGKRMPEGRVIQDRLFFLLSKTILSKIGNAAAITAAGRFAEGLPTSLRDSWGRTGKGTS